MKNEMSRDEARVWLAQHPGEWLQVMLLNGTVGAEKLRMLENGALRWSDDRTAELGNYKFAIPAPAPAPLPELSEALTKMIRAHYYGNSTVTEALAELILAESVRLCRAEIAAAEVWHNRDGDPDMGWTVKTTHALKPRPDTTAEREVK